METYTGHVKTPQDAIILFEACRLGLLPRVQRRLSEKERQMIKSGSVFVWDEREAGMRRWTDGKSWSASRVNGSFLTYREMEGKRTAGMGSNANYNHSPGREAAAGEENPSTDAPDGYRYKPDGLTKQSFSITTSQGQHLHLISYFSRSHAHSGALQQPTSDPGLRHVRPERGMYPESTLQDNSNTPALTRSPMTTIGPRYATDGSPNPVTTASTPQYAQPRQYNPYPNRPEYVQSQHWPLSPMNTPPMINGMSNNASPRYPSGSPGSAHHSSILHSSQPAYISYPPYHHREVGSSTAFDRVPPPMSSGPALPPPPTVPAPSYPPLPSTYPPPQPPLPPTSYPTPTSNPPAHTYLPPTSHPLNHLPSSGPTPPESNVLPPFRRNPSPQRERSASHGSNKDLVERDRPRATPPLTDLDKGRVSPHNKSTIPSIGALISRTPPPDYSKERERGTPPAQSGQQGPYPRQGTPTRPALGSRNGSFHSGEPAAPGRSSGDADALRKLDGAFAASR